MAHISHGKCSRIPLVPCLIIGALLFLNDFSFAAVTMPKIFGDHLVLQRERPVPVWGWANPGEKITVEFAGQRKAITAGPDGRWEVRLDPMPARNQGGVLRISGASTNIIELKDVVVGEVWVCSGQSNMAFPLKYASKAQEDIANADLPGLRFLNVALSIASSPKEDVVASLPWTRCSKQTAAECTAVGFYFGRRLHSELGVPVGLINTSWGGTRIEPWTPLEAFDTIPELAAYIAAFRKEVQIHRQTLPDAIKALETWISAARKSIAVGSDLPVEPDWPIYPGANNRLKPASIYHAMVYPLIPYAIRGTIWYQGESNNTDPGDLYYHKMCALIGGWRRTWAQGDFPFYFVQLANYQNDTKKPAGGDTWANLCRCQFKALAITNTGMAVTIDIGAALNVHPKNKFDVGERLSRWALARDYGQTNIVVSGPLYREMKIEDNRIRLFFDYLGGGLMVGEKTGRAPVREIKDGKLQRFAVAGEDKKWVWADAIFAGDTVLVSSPDLPKPVTVRYAYSTNPEGCNLYNRAGLPASPFRTDAW
ncbi:MAG: sialate O-acetylesterase [Kiritimatiellia bacterium]|nr:sialate O-acetylesterase [Kiritimatiellia bacterium]